MKTFTCAECGSDNICVQLKAWKPINHTDDWGLSTGDWGYTSPARCLGCGFTGSLGAMRAIKDERSARDEQATH